MGSQISSRSESIERVYRWYRDAKFMVNRKYQRKLVWTLEEKEAFIDSVYKQYSVPLFLLANTQREGKDCYEIIDGMQRLNAVFSFIENEFPLKINDREGYFDLNTMALTKSAHDKKQLQQHTPMLSEEDSILLLSYQLPFSFIEGTEPNRVEEIFRRINSFGRQLSKQEIRQAGAIGQFPDLVRRIAAQFRGDTSPSDILDLSEMKEISLSNRKLPYGINMDDIFWVKQNIIPAQNMRVSRDEELIAYILTYILLGTKVTPGAATLDRLYKYETGHDSPSVPSVENEIAKLGFDNIQTWFYKVYDELASMLNKGTENFRSTLFKSDKAEGLVRTYQVVFLALYELLVLEKKRVRDYDGLRRKLDGLGDKHLLGISSLDWNAEYRQQKILAIKGLFEPHFELVDNTDDAAIDNWVSRFENILSCSKIEQPQYDFKIGFYRLEESGAFDKGLLSKVVKTLTAMANTGLNKMGYVIIGVADTEEAAVQYCKIYKHNYKVFQHFYVTGIQHEIAANFTKRDDYLNKLKALIKQEPVETGIKEYILSHLKFINYYEKDILIFQLKSQDEPVAYDEKYYQRQINSVEEIIGASSTKALFARFK